MPGMRAGIHGCHYSSCPSEAGLTRTKLPSGTGRVPDSCHLLQVHGTCQTLVSDHRPVPLTWMYCHEVHRRAQLSLMDFSAASSSEPENGFLQPTELTSANRA